MRKKMIYLLNAGLFCIGVNVLSRIIFEPGPEDIADFIGGAGAGMAVAAIVGLLIQWRRDKKNGEMKVPPPGTRKLLLLVFGGLALLFLVFWLIFGPQE
jgi:drug/metabolite transporter (DMT)-like permease